MLMAMLWSDFRLRIVDARSLLLLVCEPIPKSLAKSPDLCRRVIIIKRFTMSFQRRLESRDAQIYIMSIRKD
jgi:hypothetical protein